MKNNKILGMSLTSLLIVLMIVGGASAVLVGYLSNTTTATIDVESPLVLNDGDATFIIDIVNGGEYDLVLLKVTNNADVPVYGNLELVFDDVIGFHTAISEDINYCFANMGNMTGVGDCVSDFKQWVINNPTWIDWVADKTYDALDYEASYVIDFEGDSFIALGYDGNKLVLPITSNSPIPSETTMYAIIYVDSELAISPGQHILEVIFTPVI